MISEIRCLPPAREGDERTILAAANRPQALAYPGSISVACLANQPAGTGLHMGLEHTHLRGIHTRIQIPLRKHRLAHRSYMRRRGSAPLQTERASGAV